MAPIVVLQQAQALGAQFRREVDQLADRQALHIERRRLAGDRLGRRVIFARHIANRHRRFGDRPDRLAVGAVQHKREGVLGRLRQRLDGAPAHLHVEQDRGAHQVAVPDVVMHRLVVPALLAGLGVHRHDAVGIEIVAAAEGAVIVVGRLLDGEIDQTQIGIGAVLRPVADIAGAVGGAIFPGVVAELALARDGAEGPELLAGAHIVSADIALDVTDLADRGGMRRAHHDDIAHHQRRRMQADFLARALAVGIDGLVFQVLLEINHAADAEARRNLAGLGIKADQLVADSDIEDALLLAISPIGNAMPAAGTRRQHATAAFLIVEPPELLAGAGIQRQYGALEARRMIDHPIHHQRRALDVGVARLGEGPDLFQPVEIAGIDLVQR